LNLVLVAEDERRYFKQREVTLWRKEPSADDQEQGYTRHHGTRDGEKPAPNNLFKSSNAISDSTPTPTPAPVPGPSTQDQL
jgi:hypothetical protein